MHSRSLGDVRTALEEEEEIGAARERKTRRRRYFCESLNNFRRGLAKLHSVLS